MLLCCSHLRSSLKEDGGGGRLKGGAQLGKCLVFRFPAPTYKSGWGYLHLDSQHWEAAAVGIPHPPTPSWAWVGLTVPAFHCLTFPVPSEPVWGSQDPGSCGSDAVERGRLCVRKAAVIVTQEIPRARSSLLGAVNEDQRGIFYPTAVGRQTGGHLCLPCGPPG